MSGVQAFFSELAQARRNQWKVHLLEKIQEDLRCVLPDVNQEWLGDNKPFGCSANRPKVGQVRIYQIGFLGKTSIHSADYENP